MKKFSRFCYQVLVLLVVLACLTTATFAANAVIEKKAVQSQNTFMLDGKKIAFDSAYNIEGSNYIQLRAVAQALNGTASQFNVYWDDELKAAVIETGSPYTGVKPVPVESKGVYSIGETFVTDNCEISVTDCKLQDGYAVVDLDILLKKNNVTWDIYSVIKFLDHATEENGEIHRSFMHPDGVSTDVVLGVKGSYTIMYCPESGSKMTSITVKDPITKEKAVFNLY